MCSIHSLLAQVDTVYLQCENHILSPLQAYRVLGGHAHTDTTSPQYLWAYPTAPYFSLVLLNVRGRPTADTLHYRVLQPPLPVPFIRFQAPYGPDTVQLVPGEVLFLPTDKGYNLEWQPDSAFAARCPRDARYQNGPITISKQVAYGNPIPVQQMGGGMEQLPLSYLLAGRAPGTYELKLADIWRLRYDGQHMEQNLARPLLYTLQLAP
ncbi:MAG: hypothetical protein LW884_10720 [Bacteroidetes bacterium]|jgi:hypothetical protein|nr:hypothetical protein [Bacteroidota bacterium]